MTASMQSAEPSSIEILKQLDPELLRIASPAGDRVPSGWRTVFGDDPIRDCCFVGNVPLCRRPFAVSVKENGASPVCPQCDELNDGFWYLDQIQAAEDEFVDVLGIEVPAAEEGGGPC